jgi:hypothetical protein
MHLTFKFQRFENPRRNFHVDHVVMMSDDSSFSQHEVANCFPFCSFNFLLPKTSDGSVLFCFLEALYFSAQCCAYSGKFYLIKDATNSLSTRCEPKEYNQHDDQSKHW